MHTCMMPVAPNRLVNISSVLEYASVLIGVHQVKYMEVQTMDAVKILMVDDEERMRKLVKDFLTIKGYRVLEAGDGEQAIDIFFKEKDISLVILDVMMPKMDGWETCTPDGGRYTETNEYQSSCQTLPATAFRWSAATCSHCSCCGY